jgi:hypothetical protein
MFGHVRDTFDVVKAAASDDANGGFVHGVAFSLNGEESTTKITKITKMGRV